MKVVCPVCNRLFEAECTPYKVQYNEVTYYFDTELCQIAFSREPERFAVNCKGKPEQQTL
ncbi:MAG: YHS domain-containing protein [Candidatus Aramenus sp.]|nr:YHS domain-containing protein [Candidatus Aramenus sp.]